MKNTTLLFLVKRSGNEISEICLAMKKKGFGGGRWNGVGGHVEEGESIEGATIRETKEEIDVVPGKISKVAELSFSFPHNPSWNQKVHTYICEEWEGEPAESEEMNPEWFPVSEIPFDKMWPDDIFWLPKVIKGDFIKSEFTFGEGDIILDQKVEVVLQ